MTVRAVASYSIHAKIDGLTIIKEYLEKNPPSVNDQINDWSWIPETMEDAINLYRYELKKLDAQFPQPTIR